MIPDAYFDQFQTKKYNGKNPVQRLLIRRFAERVHELFRAAGPVKSVLEVGVGEGFLSGILSKRHPGVKFTGVDIQQSDLDLLKGHFPEIETHRASVYDLSGLPGGYDLVICAEVMEHLDEPERGLRELLRFRPRHALLTVPHEPWFMLSNLVRGKNVTRFGNDIEHVNHFGIGSFKRFLSQQLDLASVTTSYPWILALGQPR